MSNILRTKSNLVKQIPFEQFLELIFALSEIKEPVLSKAN
jgi:hypothetical protein